MNSKLERLAGNMDTRFAVLLLAAAVMGAGCTQSPTPCQLQQSATGGYIVKFVRNGNAAAGCDVDTGTPAQFSDVWVFDQYTEQLIAVKSVQVPHPDNSEPNSTVYGKGKFATVNPDSSNPPICKVASLNRMSNEETKGAADPLIAYTVTDMQFLSGTDFLGTEFAATVHVERGTCAADYTAQALSPPVACSANEDCDPFHKPFSSGIQSNYHQTCITDHWTAFAADYFGGDGVCFLIDAFPSLGAFAP
jgi:hypothetical protein